MAQLHGLARLGRDAEVRFTTDGQAVANLSLAFNYGRKGEDGKRPTCWVDGSIWGKLAEAIAPYLTKGTSCAVTLDDVHIELFKKADGTPGHKLVGRVSAIELAGGGEQRQQAPSQAPQQRPTQSQAPQQRPAAQRAAPQSADNGWDNMNDDVPF